MPEEKPNNINPGKSFGRKAISGCKCLCLVGTGLTVTGIALLVLFLLGSLAKNTLAPHSAVFHDTKLEAVADRATVVQPLIGQKDKFDILVSVWLRNGDSPRHRGPQRLKKVTLPDLLGQAPIQPEEEVEDELLPVESDSDVVETPLFSEIVFRGVSLTDKNVFRDVNFTVPTAPFRGPNLANYDLRASVVLIPRSPSLLDQTTNYSTWLPGSIKPLPVRAYAPGHTITLSDHVIDTFSDTFPLLEFHGIPPQCPKTKTQEEENPFLNDGESAVVTETDQGPNTFAGSTLQTTDRRNPLYSHPYIVTRTQIRVVDETGIFNRKAYIKEHKDLKEGSCGQRTYVYPGRYFCQKNWPTSGHWETQLQLKTTNHTTGEPQTEWAYGPYVYATRYGFGQLDLVPIPVNRETCASDAEDPETMTVTWHLSYSGLSAARMALADVAGTAKYYSFNETDLEKYKAHDAAKTTNGVWGNPFSKDDYPRVRMGFYFYAIGGNFIEFFLNIRYWYTRTSTEGISIDGTNLLAAGLILPTLLELYTQNAGQGYTIPGWIALLLAKIVTALPVAILMLKATNRVYFHWWTKTSWLPAAGRRDPSKAEKASERMESGLSWTFKGGLLLGLFVANWYLDIPRYVLVHASFPLPKKEETLYSTFMPALVYTIKVTGQILQLIMNAKTRKYAGAYPITTFFEFSMTPIMILEESTTLLGKDKHTMDLPFQKVVDFTIQAIAAYQAWSLPSVKQKADELHEE